MTDVNKVGRYIFALTEKQKQTHLYLFPNATKQLTLHMPDAECVVSLAIIITQS